jgi:DNA polymerase-4
MNKPDGLTVIEQADLPHALHGLGLRDLCGIGPSMETRLQRAGITTTEQLCAASRNQLRRAWGNIQGERFWLQLQGFDLPERVTRRASVGHSHVLGPELRTFAGMRSVLFKLLAKAAMRLRSEGLLAGGMSVAIRFIGLEARFEKHLRFAPIDDTPALLRLLGQNLQGLEHAVENGRWNQKRHPPLSVAVTLVDLSPLIGICGDLMAEQGRSREASTLLDGVNRKYGNNTLYLGSMANAVAHNAAPMRIAFQQVPEPALEEESALHAIEQLPCDAGHLLQVRMNQFKALAEKTHRERETKRHLPAGAGGWGSAKQPQVCQQASLF